ncbi:hypothetical protein [Aeromonas salmonicida]|uniref:hypothetical protein n=1 Tax=Aeromonas salmonicida TaxID=645 RepID=UPI001F3409B0|nr:hypothetical protein [Aeromonas salmonicida]MCE9933614.1 hypothetical protein [Aeromonas salmonicida]
MIKTTRINADLLAAMQDVASDKFELNAILRGEIPEALALHTWRIDRWEIDWADEVREVAATKDSAIDVDTGDVWDLFRWNAATLGGEVSSLMGWDREVQVVDMIQAGTGWNNLYLFTSPVSNTIAQVLAVWADDEYDAVAALEEWVDRTCDEEGIEEYEEIKAFAELWETSPAYCVEAA